MTRSYAWAAGLFDGEGYICVHSRRPQPQLGVGQSDRRVLDRFRRTLAVGTVRGPYKKPGRRKPYFVYYVYGFAAVRRIARLLWRWLDTVKRQQFRLVKCAPKQSRRVLY